MIKYKLPTAEDLSEILRLAREMHSETSFRDLSFDEDRARSEIFSCINDPQNFVCVAEKEGRLVGVIGVYLASPFFSNDRVVYDHLWFVSKEVRGSMVGPRLLRFVSQWATYQDAKAIFLTLGSGIGSERTGKMAELHGYRQLGGYYRKDLTNVEFRTAP